MNKILSVSIAAYNVEKYLPKLFEVLKVNEYVRESIELIVVNDGSKDNTLGVAKKYVEEFRNSITIIDKENGGYGSTINSAIKVAKGGYFRVLDGDDWFNNNNINDYLKYLENSNDDVIITPFEKIFEDGREIELIDQHQDADLYSSPLQMHEITVKTELYRNKANPITEHCFYTDVEYALNVMLIAKTISKYNKPIYCYRIGREGQSISIESRKKYINDDEKVCRKCLDLYSRYKKLDYHGLDVLLSSAILFYYQGLIITFETRGINKIKEFDNFIKKEYKNEYHVVEDNCKRIKLIRIMNYNFPSLIKKILLRKK